MKLMGNRGLPTAQRSWAQFTSLRTRVLWQLALSIASGGQLLACHSDNDAVIAKAPPKVAPVTDAGTHVGNDTGTDAGTDAGVDEPLTSKNSDVVFDDNALWRFDLTATEADLATLNANIALEQSIPAQLSAGGHDIGQVGFHYKGSAGTLYNCLDATGHSICRKLGVKLEFNAIDAGKRFYGLKKLNLNSSVWDDSLMHERLSYSLFREMNVHTSRATHALLYVNGDFWGVFSMIEEIDGRFDDYNFPGKGNGNLFKECWPTSTDPTYYAKCLKTNTAKNDTSGMLAFGSDIAAATDATLPDVIAKYTDVDYLMRYLAVDRGIAANDGIMAFWTDNTWLTNHNYYWYQDESELKFWLIPWDMYSTFTPLTPLDWVPAWDQPPGDCSARYASWNTGMWYQAPGCDKLIHGFSLLDRSGYLAAVQQLLDGPFQLDAINQKIDRWSAQIADAVAQDTHGPTVSGFKGALSVLKSSAITMRERMQNVLAGLPTTPTGLKLNQVNGFEDANAVSLVSGSAEYCNSTSTLSLGLNQTNPISGSKDARIDFTFRDQSENASDAYQQWAMVDFAVANWNIDLVAAGITELHFNARADQDRTVRIDLSSPNNSQENQGICLGWDVPLSATPKAIVVKLAAAAIPSWDTTRANAPHDDPQKVFSSIRGLMPTTPMRTRRCGAMSLRTISCQCAMLAGGASSRRSWQTKSSTRSRWSISGTS